MPDRAKHIPGKSPHCPICDSDLKLIQCDGILGACIYWSCECSDEDLQPYVSSSKAYTEEFSNIEYSKFVPCTSKWTNREWAYYYKCQQVRIIY